MRGVEAVSTVRERGLLSPEAPSLTFYSRCPVAHANVFSTPAVDGALRSYFPFIFTLRVAFLTALH